MDCAENYGENVENSSDSVIKGHSWQNLGSVMGAHPYPKLKEEATF